MTADNFQRNVILSLIAHGFVAMFIFLRAVFIPSEPIEIRKAIRVDIVGLPQKMTEATLPPPAPEPAAAPAPTPAPAAKPQPVAELPAKAQPKPETKAPTVNLDKTKPEKEKADTKKAQRSALDKIKQMAALEKLNSADTKEKAPAKAGGAIAGNQVSAGNSLTGLEKIEYDRYFDELEGKVRTNWNIPQWLAESRLKAQVQVLIDEQGYIIKKVMRRSSGNEIFDSKVIEALESSSPLPVPPKRLHGVLSTSGIVLNFPE